MALLLPWLFYTEFNLLLKNYIFYAHVHVSQDESNIKEDTTVASGHISLTHCVFTAEEVAVSGAWCPRPQT